MLKKILLSLILLSPAAFAGPTIEFSQYHSQAVINQYLKDLAAAYPQLVHFYTAGTSDEGRDINYITVTTGNDQLPGIFFNGTHHGDEWSSTEGILGLIAYIVEHRSDAEMASLLAHYVFYLEPVVNPDGHAIQSRWDANGVDPNRDYAFPGAGNAQWHSKIIKVMRKLVDSHKFRAAAAYHSGIEEVLWPWCYTSAPTNQKDLFYTYAKKAAVAMNMSRYLQSYDDYATEGEFIDYLFMSQGTFALTYEVSSIKTPDPQDLAPIVQRSVDGAMAFIRAIAAQDAGQLAVETAPPVTDMPKHPLWERLGEKLE